MMNTNTNNQQREERGKERKTTKMKRTRQFTHLGGRKASTATLFAATALALVEAVNVSDSSAPLFPASVEMPFPSVTGPLEDASCDVEQLEQANDSQSFAVDLKQKCPLVAWDRSTKKEKVDQSKSKEEPEESCAGGLPEADAGAEPACSVDVGSPFGTSVGGVGNMAAYPSDSDSEVGGDDAEEFECTGGRDELDEEAEPLCSLTTDESAGPFSSSALHSISEQIGTNNRWESESQQNTFAWKQETDPVVEHDDEPCEDDSSAGNLPETFWLDICSEIKSGDGMSIVDLQLNPERNTGYNGTHIWNAIYDENCLAVDTTKSEMCYEERVLYRLLSGLHTSTTLSIAKNYYPPSKRKGRVNWEPNPQYFIDKFSDHPEHLRNLHFSYVVLLRALKKASPFLYNFQISTGDTLDDTTASLLLRRLLDTSILRSCQDVFSAFDESLMFKDQDSVMLQENFKGVFHNVSSILDCVQCQQCKLHGKMAMLGYGAALKILFTREDLIALSRNELVAFLNTIGKLSESVREVPMLTKLYWSTHTRLEKSTDTPSSSEGSSVAQSAGIDSVDLLDSAVGGNFVTGKSGHDRRASRGEISDLRKFFNFLPNIGGAVGDSARTEEPDAIVVGEKHLRHDATHVEFPLTLCRTFQGTGLAGLTATLNILDRGGRVVLIEKEHRMGGNSNKASSGINACCPQNSTYGDDLDTFRKDTTRSASSSAKPHLIETLVDNSEAAVNWLKSRVGVDLSVLAQLGGHGHKRTHRPNQGMVGAEIIFHISRAVKSYSNSGALKIMMDTKVESLIRNDKGSVIGVHVVSTDGDNSTEAITAPNVVLATGGFASDRSPGSYLEKYRPELMKMPASDGITLGSSVGAGLVDMDKIQVHPTGWVDPSDPTNPGKVLAGELMRGVGGILFNSKGERAYVTDKMFSHDRYYNESKTWNITRDIPVFSLVLSSSAAEGARKHVDHYLNKGLLRKIEGVESLANWMNVPISDLLGTLRQYQRDAKTGHDEWGKTSFFGVPATDLSSETFFAGTVTPVLHYCMGGLTIDKYGSVIDEDDNVIPGLHAAGEVSGGVHGDNRLGGNSLLECTVFGSIVGKKIPIKSARTQQANRPALSPAASTDTPLLTMADVEKHNTDDDVWIAIHGKVYDLTDFAEEHPAGPESILELAGKDGTEEFAAVHSAGILDDFDPVGRIEN
ncbi:hypothetical protein THAOC_00669 [Thalassiosira oceanica]|uniref:Cytochrome b5 heme-binding domain-containing protein n=1 Tax=Thalassiosira oceanica TaxID=159749 RepID=K0TFE6_THAOC|nr:hypothetical protein THAOC_00669 [Thalassiosira oceanica]|eukprot:EJK77498.1 hypothetical protein THAOC_00669 [Thalassiosira oceanica]